MKDRAVRFRLIVMNFVEFAIWGAYLTSMGNYLSNVGLVSKIGWFYSIQGIVSLFMPALMGTVADRWIQPQRLLSICHVIAAIFMGAAAFYGMMAGDNVQFSMLFSLYTVSVAFYMPTLALSNSVAYNVLTSNKLDIVKAFPPIRVFGTIGFICTMISVDLLKFQSNYKQFMVSAVLSLILAVYALTLPACPLHKKQKSKSFIESMGLDAFALFKQWKMAVFFIFSMLLGVSLQITNAYANPYITGFDKFAEYAHSFGTEHANVLISLSQVSETCCILLIPFFLKHFGIKRVMLIAMFAWVLRFGLFGLGNPGDGVWMFVLSMIVYGVAFDFFNISGSLYVDRETDPAIRSSAQGVFMMMTNGLGATIGTLGAQFILNKHVFEVPEALQLQGWRTSWFIFAGYALVVGLLFAVIFKERSSAKPTTK